MLKSIFLLSYLSFVLSIFSQNIDSLKIDALSTPLDSVKAVNFYRIAMFYSRRNEIDSAKKYNSLSLGKVQENEELKFNVIKLEATIYARAGDYKIADSILKYVSKSLKNSTLPDSTKQKHFLSIYVTLGIVNSQTNNNSEALNYYLEGVKIAKSINREGALAVFYNNIGNIYITEEDDSLAVIYLKKAQEIYRKTDNIKGLYSSYINLANISKYNNRIQEAIDRFNIAQEYALKANDSVAFASTINRIGSCYLTLYEDTNGELSTASELALSNKDNLLDLALSYFLRSKKILESKKVSLSNLNNEIAKVFYFQRRYKDAIDLYLQTYKELDLYAINSKITATEGLKNSYMKANKNKLALKWSEELSRLNDTLKNRENLKEFGRKQAELDFIKTKEIDSLKHQKELSLIKFSNEKNKIISENKKKKQTYIIWSVTVSLFIAGLFLILIFRRWKLTHRQKELINKQKEQIEKDKKATDDSINYAKSIQEAAFPSLEDINDVVPKNFILFKPKDTVSGDFYWAKRVGNKRIIALGDCTGHGVPGAFMTLISLNILNQLTSEGFDTPNEILEQLHFRLQKKLSKTSKHGLDIAVCAIETDKVSFSGVHIPVYFVQNGNLTEFKGQKFQLGGNDATVFNQQEITTNINDIFYISTDGFPDQKGGTRGKKYYYPPLRKKLLSIAELDLDKQLKILDEEFINWKGKAEQLDDVSIIGFKI